MNRVMLPSNQNLVVFAPDRIPPKITQLWALLRPLDGKAMIFLLLSRQAIRQVILKRSKTVPNKQNQATISPRKYFATLVSSQIGSNIPPETPTPRPTHKSRAAPSSPRRGLRKRRRLPGRYNRAESLWAHRLADPPARRKTFLVS